MPTRSDLLSAQIFKVNQLGDNVVFLPVIQRLVTESIFAELVLWTTPLASPLYRNLARPLRLEISARQEFYPAWKSPRTLLNLARRARAARPDMTLVAEDMGNTAYLLALLSGAPLRIGIKPPYLKIPFAINAVTHLDPNAPEPEKCWALGKALARTAGIHPWSDRPPPPNLDHLTSSPAERHDILIHPGASRAYKRWPLDRYQELASRLAREFRVGWLQTPGEPEVDLHDASTLRPSTLDDLVSLLARCATFVGNNSGPMHLASALGVPSVILTGSSSRTWDPYWFSERARVLRDETLPCIACDRPGLPLLERCTNRRFPMACMDNWTVNRVEAEVREWHRQWEGLRI